MSILSHRLCAPFLCIVLVLAAGALPAQQPRRMGPPPEKRNFESSIPINAKMQSHELSRVLDAYLAKQAADDQFSGVVLVARNYKPIFRKAYGFADRANKRPINLQTRFNLGSLNKSFTGVAIAQLVSQGKLAYTDTLGAILPDYPQTASHSATVEQLLNMTAGLTDLFGPEFYEAPKDRFRTNADFYDFASKLPPLFPPGERMQHCNGCYIVLGEMIERITQVPYEQYVSENIFSPAHMTNTASLQADAIESNLAVGYTKRPDGSALRMNTFLHGAGGSAAGGGFSTADDLLSFLNTDAMKGKGMAINGSNAGVSNAIQAGREWIVIVLTNLDPPAGDRVASMIYDALTTGS
jgi:D-alanyl-D-alanine carboxypeptidase